MASVNEKGWMIQQIQRMAYNASLSNGALAWGRKENDGFLSQDPRDKVTMVSWDQKE